MDIPEGKIWHYSIAGSKDQQGPLSLTDIKQLIQNKQLGEKDLLWHGGWEKWTPLLEVPEFSSLLPDVKSTSLKIENPCSNHGTQPAIWQCSACGGQFCSDCVSLVPFGEQTTASCKVCGKNCVQISKTVADIRKSAIPLLMKSFAYPFKGGGIAMLIIGSIFFVLLEVLKAGLYQFFIAAFALAFFMSYMFKIVQSSADGKDEMPDWPSVMGTGADIWWPLPVILGIIAIYFGPAIACFIGIVKYPQLQYVALAFFITGTYCLPMALLAGGLGTRKYLNPFGIFASTFKVFGTYIIALILIVIVEVLDLLMHKEMITLIHPLVMIFLGTLVSFYFSIVTMRVLGLIYYLNSDRLNFRDY